MEECGGPETVGGKRKKSEDGLCNRKNAGGDNSAQIAQVQSRKGWLQLLRKHNSMIVSTCNV